MPEYCLTRSPTTACFTAQTAEGTCQNRRILQLKIVLVASVKNPTSRMFTGALPMFLHRSSNACRSHGHASTIGGMNPGFSRTAVCFFAVALATAAAFADEPKTPATDP